MRIPAIIQNNLPEIRMPSASQVVKNLTKIALPAIALVAATRTQEAEAGPLLEATCIITCAGSAYFIPIMFVWQAQCYAACMAAGFLPTP